MTRGLLLSLLVVVPGCRDPGEDAWAKAKRRHRELVTAQVPLPSKDYDELLALLAAVPPDTKHAVEAQRLKAAVVGARAKLPLPLAAVHRSSDDAPPAMAAQQRACARLVELLAADGGLTDAGRATIADCNRRAQRLDTREHEGEP